MGVYEIVWAIDANQVPYVRDTRCMYFEVVAKYDNSLGADAKKWPVVYCWRVDGKYVAVAYDARSKKLYACAEYKFFSGFKRWLERFYPMANLVPQFEVKERRG